MSVDSFSEEIVTDEQLRSIVAQVWESLLSSPPAEEFWYQQEIRTRSEQADLDDEIVWASVSLTGDWSGSINVGTASQVAARMTRSMLGLDDAEPLEAEDVTDAIGEVANVLGGNVKSLLPGHTRLTLPDVRNDVPESSAYRSVLIGYEGGDVAITISDLKQVADAPVPAEEY